MALFEVHEKREGLVRGSNVGPMMEKRSQNGSEQ